MNNGLPLDEFLVLFAEAAEKWDEPEVAETIRKEGSAGNVADALSDDLAAFELTMAIEDALEEETGQDVELECDEVRNGLVTAYDYYLCACKVLGADPEPMPETA